MWWNALCFLTMRLSQYLILHIWLTLPIKFPLSVTKDSHYLLPPPTLIFFPPVPCFSHQKPYIRVPATLWYPFLSFPAPQSQPLFSLYPFLSTPMTMLFSTASLSSRLSWLLPLKLLQLRTPHWTWWSNILEGRKHVSFNFIFLQLINKYSTQHKISVQY